MIAIPLPRIMPRRVQELAETPPPRAARFMYSALATVIAALASVLLAGSSVTYAPLHAAVPHQNTIGPPRAGTDNVPPMTVLPGTPGGDGDPSTEIDSDSARTLNAAAAFVPLGPDHPTSVRFSEKSGDFARALDCLASAVLYEAGDDPAGQAAVAQVVINRVHHPAFPRTVCAVVYQGSERATGCQFTFTCDGALRRLPSPAAWQRARKLAESFLEGRAEPAVGLATHYHTDWVHPYWSDSLDKVARVGTHLFFRWRGDWGRQPAFTAIRVGPEPVEPELAALSQAHRNAPPGNDSALAPTGAAETSGRPVAAEMIAAGPGDHFIQTDAGGNGGNLAIGALDLCRGQLRCKVISWDRRAEAYGSPATPLVRTVSFLYVRDVRTGVEVVLWDCARYNRPLDSQCLSAGNRYWITFTGSLARKRTDSAVEAPN